LEINSAQLKPLTRANYCTLDGRPIRAPKAPTVVIPTIKGVTPFSAHHNRAQRGFLAAMIEAARLWHVRLGHIGLNLLRKTALVTKGMPDFSGVRPEHIACKSCNAAKLLQQPSSKAVADPPNALGRIEGDMFVIRPMPLNNKPYGLILVDRKTRFKIIRLLKSKNEVVTEAKAAIEKINNTFKRYPAHLHYDRGKEISRLRPYLREKGIVFSESSPYAHNQNNLAERTIRVVLERLRAVMVASGLPSSL